MRDFLTNFSESTECALAGPNGFDCGTDDFEGPEGQMCDRCRTWDYLVTLEDLARQVRNWARVEKCAADEHHDGSNASELEARANNLLDEIRRAVHRMAVQP